MTTLDQLRRDIARALCLEDDDVEPCGVCWAAAGDVLPVVMEYAAAAAPPEDRPVHLAGVLTGVWTPPYTSPMTTSRTLKVRIPITVEIDIDSWVDNYGGESAVEVRTDVRQHIENMVRSQLDELGVLAPHA